MLCFNHLVTCSSCNKCEPPEDTWKWYKFIQNTKKIIDKKWSKNKFVTFPRIVRRFTVIARSQLSWKSGNPSTCLSVSLNVKYSQIRDKNVLIIRSAMEDSVSWFCAVEKWICFFFRKRSKSLLANSRPRSVYKNNVFSPPLFTIYAKALRGDLLVLFFSGSAHAKFENFSTTIKTNVWLLMNIFGFGKPIKSACHWSSTPLTTVCRRWKLRRTRWCKGSHDEQSVGGKCV